MMVKTIHYKFNILLSDFEKSLPLGKYCLINLLLLFSFVPFSQTESSSARIGFNSWLIVDLLFPIPLAISDWEYPVFKYADTGIFVLW